MKLNFDLLQRIHAAKGGCVTAPTEYGPPRVGSFQVRILVYPQHNIVYKGKRQNSKPAERVISKDFRIYTLCTESLKKRGIEVNATVD